MKSKLGPYIISTGGFDCVGYFARAKPCVAVSMEHSVETWKEIKQLSPNTFVIGRHFIDDGAQHFDDDPEGKAEWFFSLMFPYVEKMRGLYDAWMGYNESVIKTVEQAKALSRWHVRWGDLCKKNGIVSAAYSFATGNPELDLWPYLEEGLSHCDLLSLHEYSAPTMDNVQSWLCLRYRRAMEALSPAVRRPVVITETGIDGGVYVTDKPMDGWSKFTDEAGYLKTLQWYDNEMQKDDYILGAAIFAANGWGNNGSFGMSELRSIRDYIGSTGEPPKVNIKMPVMGGAKPQPAAPAQPVTPAQPAKPATPPPPAQPATPPPAQPSADGNSYTVQGGDTLFGIARKFGVSVDALVAANNIADRRVIKPGQVLRIPKK